jgi:hypothetical protein
MHRGCWISPEKEVAAICSVLGEQNMRRWFCTAGTRVGEVQEEAGREGRGAALGLVCLGAAAVYIERARRGSRRRGAGARERRGRGSGVLYISGGGLKERLGRERGGDARLPAVMAIMASAEWMWERRRRGRGGVNDGSSDGEQ